MIRALMSYAALSAAIAAVVTYRAIVSHQREGRPLTGLLALAVFVGIAAAWPGALCARMMFGDPAKEQP